MQAKSLQSCPMLFDPVDCSPPGSSVHGDSPGKDNRVGWHFLLLSGEIPGLKNRYSCQHAVTSDNTQKNCTKKIFTTQIITMV